jgi:hypothetical protein
MKVIFILILSFVVHFNYKLKSFILRKESEYYLKKMIIKCSY